MINGKYYQKNFGVENQVFFDGTLPGGQPVYDWLDDLDLYLIPSLQEGLPRALVEAMSRGCPAIGAKTGGIPELLGKDCIYGRKNYKKLAKKIKMILYNKSKLVELAKKNYNKSLEFENLKLEQKRDNFMKKILKN